MYDDRSYKMAAANTTYNSKGEAVIPAGDEWLEESEWDEMYEKMRNEKAWNFAIGLAQLDGIKVSNEFLELVEREKKGEITGDDIRRALYKKYKRDNDGGK